MEIESFWKGLPGFKNPEKGSKGIGYGYRTKHRSLYDSKCQKRKAYRQIRKYGFDLSETWSLDTTIMRWLSDNVGGFFRICGLTDSWNDYDLEGNKYDFWIHHKDDDWCQKSQLYSNTRYESYQEHLKDFLNNCEVELFDAFRDFVIPRLRMLAKVVHGWPVDDDFPKFEDWVKAINKMADDFEAGECCPENFIKHFWSLWD